MSLTSVLTFAAVVGMAGTAFGQGGGAGTISYVQGQAAIAGGPLMPGSEGRTVLQPGQMLSTGTGRAAVELTPGVMLRLEPASAVKMVVGEPSRSEVMLESGRADVIVGNVSGSRDLQIDTAGGVQTLLLERGVYAFDAKAGELKVYDGKAAVSQKEDAKWINVKGGHELALNGSASKSVEFDEAQDREFFGQGGAYGYDGGYGRGYGAYALGDGYGYEPGYGFGGYGFGGYGYGDGYPGLFAYGVYPGFYGGFYPGFYGGYRYGFGGGFGGYGFRGGRR